MQTYADVCRRMLTYTDVRRYFNTSCSHRRADRECGHSGWFQEGGFIASCTDKSDCESDDTRSTLDLYISLETIGTLFTCFNADVC